MKVVQGDRHATWRERGPQTWFALQVSVTRVRMLGEVMRRCNAYTSCVTSTRLPIGTGVSPSSFTVKTAGGPRSVRNSQGPTTELVMFTARSSTSGSVLMVTTPKGFTPARLALAAVGFWVLMTPTFALVNFLADGGRPFLEELRSSVFWGATSALVFAFLLLWLERRQQKNSKPRS